jgi:hypothetical protein
MSLGKLGQSRQLKLMRSTQADEGNVAMIGLGRGTAVEVRSRLGSQAGAAGTGLTACSASRQNCLHLGWSQLSGLTGYSYTTEKQYGGILGKEAWQDL